jgi:UDP:flavonoid glycosyltransferase YjiC (YdhE family)
MTIRQNSSQYGAMEKPNIIMSALPLYGHTMPTRAVARGLIRLGFTVTYISVPDYRTAMEDIGARFEPLSGYWTLSESNLATRFPERANCPAGIS